MAEVGRVRVCDPGNLLPGGFWDAVAVWLERPQVANKRLCGASLEARRRVAAPRAEVRGGAGRARGAAGYAPLAAPGPRAGSLRGAASPRPELGPEQGVSSFGREEAQGQRGAPARGAAGREGVGPAADLDSLWGRVSQRFGGGTPEMRAFLARSGAGSEAARELDLVLRTVIPKINPHCPITAPRREVVVQDVPSGTVTFLPLEEDDEGNLEVQMSSVYQIRLDHCSQAEWFICVLIFCPEKWHPDGVLCPTPAWLGVELPARLARWCVASRRSEFPSTLSLLPLGRYSTVYQALKEKYKDMVKVWPEVTDPEKFVYEDVAIATYLLVLWEQERAERGVSTRQSFVDLGCGNGLLVHILCSEGHPGRGIDVRRRRIWDMYGPQTQLEEEAITPSDDTLFPDVDWLIGNHSDELTPWIPVIAARSSYRCRFFVLPCCFFDFTGRYRRQQSRKTQYREYVDFIRDVGQACGFHVEEDCLRIPSTKRVCLIGKSRTYPPAMEACADEQRTQYLQSRRGYPRSPPGRACIPPGPRLAADHAGHRDSQGAVETRATELGTGAQATGLWLPGFQPRERAERVRNCATLPRDFIDHVVLQVANLLLDRKKWSTRNSQESSEQAWNEGGSLTLAEVASELGRAALQKLKQQCGGLQTLLRNSHQVFRVLHGRVHIRDWRQELERGTPPEAFKTRMCWFFMYHPDGCVLPSTSCPYAHGPGELRPPRPSKKQRQAL
ncbi:putative tRNA (uracil-O(2)-)-methyltransferase [Ctenodactylus gundi]